MDRKLAYNIGYIVIAFSIIAVLQFWAAQRDVAEISYTDLNRLVTEQKIKAAIVTETTVRGEFNEPQDGRRFFVMQRVDPAMAEKLSSAGIKVSGGTDS